MMTAHGTSPTAGPTGSPATKVLIVEDDTALRTMLLAVLRAEGSAVEEARNLVDAQAALTRAAAAHAPPALVILDLNLPDGQGGDLFDRHPALRNIATLVISARSEESHKIALLDAGADDYLVKPFGVGELLARIRVALRRRPGAPAAPAADYAYDGLVVDLAARKVMRHDDPLKLTPTEFNILTVLVKRAGRVVTHRQLLVEVWGAEYAEHTHYLRVYIGNLRAKLEADPTAPRYLQTEIGVGYRLAVE